MQTSPMNRRTFIKGAGSAAVIAGTAMTTANAAFADNATEETASEVPSWLGEEPVIDDADVEGEDSADVIVIGLSDSGSVAVRAAAEAGATVIGIEKGSDVAFCGEDVAIINGSYNEAWGRTDIVPKETIINTHMDECGYDVKRPIFKRYIEESGEAWDWILSAVDGLYVAQAQYEEIPEEYGTSYIAPYYWPTPEGADWSKEAHPTFPTSVHIPNLGAVTKAQVAAAEATGNFTGYFGHAAVKLIMEDGRCIGVYTRNYETSKYKKFTANKGVILCCGDYVMNDDMMRYYLPVFFDHELTRMNFMSDVEGNSANVGDGYKMAMWAGARIQAHHAPAIHNMGGGAKQNNGYGVMGVSGYLQLNLRGERFMNEDLPGQQVEEQVELQPQFCSYQFFDAAWPEQVAAFPAAHGTVDKYMDEYPANTQSAKKNARTPGFIEEAVERGACVKADTIEELLAQLEGMDVEAAKVSIERYNELAANGCDEDFGKVASRLFPLDTPPFYAAKIVTANVLVCLGGVESDEYCRAYSTEREPIPGLYVAGNMQGNRFAYRYPICLKGCSVGMAMTMGKIAGESAAAGK